MRHLMIDLETLGTGPNSVFLSLAAVQFDLDSGTIGEHFKQNINLQSAMDWGLTIDANTLQWWLKQRPEIMRLMFDDPSPLHHVLNRFALFIRTHEIQYVWGNSARFDLGILENGYKKADIDVPWSFRNERCYRTVIGLFPPTEEQWSTAKANDDVLAHDPVYDCHKQIKLLTGVYNKIWNLNARNS